MHGLTARLGPSGLRVDGPRTDAPTTVTDVRGRDGTLVGAVYGPVTTGEAESVVRRLSLGGDPGGPDVPWVAVARHGPGGLAAAASMMMPSGVFWSAAEGELVVATDPVSAAARPCIDAEYVRAYAAGRTSPHAAPFIGVARETAGSTVAWTHPGATPDIHVWCGPATWADPTLEGPEALAAYANALDAVVAELARRSGPVIATVSGGLDSTFVAASLARVADARSPVRGLVYAPLPEAMLASDADEAALAELMADAYPGRLTVERIVNTALIRPLDSAAEMSRRAGVPTFNPANQPWLTRMREIAAGDGAAMWFVGSNGNAAFSYHHPYAADYYLRRGRLPEVISIAREGGLRTRVLGPLRRQYLGRGPNEAMSMDRDEYLRWLARSVTGLPAAGNPAAMAGVLMADPFASRGVIEAAASITPAEWARGGVARGFARRAGAGRVPDSIRMRTGRGLQGRDAWFVIRNDRDDYLDRVAALPAVVGLEDVDHRGMQAQVSAWPWADVRGPQWQEQVAVDRTLALAEFVSIW